MYDPYPAVSDGVHLLLFLTSPPLGSASTLAPSLLPLVEALTEVAAALAAKLPGGGEARPAIALATRLALTA